MNKCTLCKDNFESSEDEEKHYIYFSPKAGVKLCEDCYRNNDQVSCLRVEVKILYLILVLWALHSYFMTSI